MGDGQQDYVMEETILHEAKRLTHAQAIERDELPQLGRLIKRILGRRLWEGKWRSDDY